MNSGLERQEEIRVQQEAAAGEHRTESTSIAALGSIVLLSAIVSYLSWNYLLLSETYSDLTGVAAAAVLYWLYSTFRGVVSIVLSLLWAAVIGYWFINDLTTGWRLIVIILGIYFAIGMHTQRIRSLYVRHWS